MIYNDFFDKPKADFVASLSDYCTPDELRYVRDMITAIVKKKTKKAVGPLPERRSGCNLKENLLRDIYCLYSYGEGAINDLLKNMIKCDPKFSSQGIQTDSCLNDTLFASKSDLDNLKAELLYKMTEIRSEMNALNSVPSLSKSGPLSSNHPQVVQLSSIHHPPAYSLPYTQSSPHNLSNEGNLCFHDKMSFLDNFSKKNNSESTNINFRLNSNAHINSYVNNVFKHSQSTMKERHIWD